MREASPRRYNRVTEDLTKRLRERWQSRSPKDVANQFSGPLFGTAGEWDLPKDVKPKRDLLYMAVGIPDADSLPKAALDAASQAVFSKPGDLALRYGFGQGPEGIRTWLANRRNQIECGHTPVTADWFQLTNGSSGAIDLIVRSLIDPGDVIVAENPTYMGTLLNFKGVGAQVRSVAMDHEGLLTDELDRTITALKAEGKRVKLIYTISAYQNPTGVTLSEQRRVELLEVAYKHDVMILDDEAYSELWFEKPPPQALSARCDGYGVITTGTFSKTVATGIRVGYIHARPELLNLFGRMRFAMGQNQSGLRAFGEFLASGAYEPHLDHVRAIYRNKRDVLHAALLREVSDYLDWEKPEGGFYLWATLKKGMQVEALWRTCVSEGIAVNPGTGFSTGGSNSIRIAYPWTRVDQFDEAARRIRLACERVVSGDIA